MWALERLHRLLVGEDKKTEAVSLKLQQLKAPNSALGCLLEELPQSLLRQYEYEDSSVRAGLHLMHSDFFKVVLQIVLRNKEVIGINLQVLIALACDLELDKMIGILDNHKWLWFRKYCHAARVAKSLIHRTPLPMNFCQEVRKKLLDSNAELTEGYYEYENNSVFKKEHDEQLLIWLNR